MRHDFEAPPGATQKPLPGTKADAVEKKLWEMLLQLPLLAPPLGSYVPVVKTGKLVFISGQLPLSDNTLGSFKGRLGKEITVDAAQRAAKLCTLNALAWLKKEIGSLEKVARVVKITGFVAGMPGFHEQATVINGASNLLTSLFGDAGKHARSSVGVTDLPLGACVEIEFIFEVK